MSDYTSNNWRYQNMNKRFKEKFGSHTRKTFSRFTTEDRNTLNITHYTQSTTVWNLKPGWWGSLLVQEKYQEEKACDKRPQDDMRQDWWNSQRTDNWGFECCLLSHRGLWGLLPPLVQCLLKLQFRQSWRMTLLMNVSLTLSSSHTATLKPKESRWSTQSTSHRMGYFFIILVKLARIYLSYDFNYETYPMPFGYVLAWTVT